MKEEREGINRREFIIASGLGLAAGTGAGLAITKALYNRQLNVLLAQIEVLKTEGATVSLQATQDAWDLQEYRVEATSEAYSRDQKALEETMRRIPSTLIQNSCRLLLEYSNYTPAKRVQLFEALGSGIISLHGKNRNLLVYLTAGHVLEVDSGFTINTFVISQPHVNGQKTLLNSKDVTSYVDESSGIGIAVLDAGRFEQEITFSQEIFIKEDWAPQVGEELYSLSFPQKAEDGIGFTPSVFKVTKVSEVGAKVQRVVGDSVIGEGSSGAAVAKGDGAVVGIYVEVGILGSFIVPIGDSYTRLLKSTGLA